MMMDLHVWLKFASIFSLIFGHCAANSVYRVNRQDFPQNGGASPASYQQPLETRNGVYRVQRQDYTNTNDVPFSDPYSNPYANRFSKINHVYGNVSKSYTPFPKLFLPASVPRTENPYLAIGFPNYDRVMPASNYGKESQARTSAPTRVTLKPKITSYDDEKQYDDGALPALPNSPQYDSPALPSISEYSKSLPYDEDFSSLVEQFEMTEDKKNICKGVNCRTSNSNDASTVVPIRRKRSIEADYDPYYSYYRRPYHWNGLEPDSGYIGHSKFSKPSFYHHDHDRVFSYLNPVLKNDLNRDETIDKTSSYEPSTTENQILSEETEPSSPADFTEDNENTSISNDAEISTLPEFSTESTAKFDLSAEKDSEYDSDVYHPYYSRKSSFHHTNNEHPHYPSSDFMPDHENGLFYNNGETSWTDWVDDETTLSEFLIESTAISDLNETNDSERKNNTELPQSLIWTEDTFKSTPVSTESASTFNPTVSNNQYDFYPDNNNEALPFYDFENNPQFADELTPEVTNKPSDVDDAISSTEPSVNPNQGSGLKDTPIECKFYSETTNSEIGPEITESFNSATDDLQNNVKISSTTEIFEPENENKYDLLTMDFEAIINSALKESMPSETIISDNFEVYSTELSVEPVESKHDDGISSISTENEFHSETSATESNSEVNIDTTQSMTDFKNNLEVTSAQTAVSEEHTVYFPTGSDEQLLEYRFRIAFVCTMWPKLYQKSKFDFYDAEMKNMYYLCNFYNALNEHIDTPSDKVIKYEDESEANVTGKPAKGDFRDWLIQMFIKSVDQSSELDKDNRALPSSSNIPMVYNLRNF